MSFLARKTDQEVLSHSELEGDLDLAKFQFFSQLMYDLSGVNLPHSEKNEALVKNRLTKLCRQSGIKSFQELRMRMENNPSAELVSQFVSALTTNKTHFFREDAHFHFFAEKLKEHFKNHHELRVWCAASSTGQEPYTTAMVMSENLDKAYLPKTKFLATDIDLQVLQKAAKGVYTNSEMEGCPEVLRHKYFDKINSGEVKFRAKDSIAKMVHFAPLNLIQGPYPFQHKFHFIFCRNVLIYFDPETTKKVIQNMVEHLAPGGYLILGHSESGTVKNPNIKALARAIYQKV